MHFPESDLNLRNGLCLDNPRKFLLSIYISHRLIVLSSITSTLITKQVNHMEITGFRENLEGQKLNSAELFSL